MEGNDKVYRSRKKIILDNFIGGISWSIGAWIGTTIILAIVAYFLSKFNFIPIIGNFVAQISKYVVVTNSPFHF